MSTGSLIGDSNIAEEPDFNFCEFELDPEQTLDVINTEPTECCPCVKGRIKDCADFWENAWVTGPPIRNEDSVGGLQTPVYVHPYPVPCN